MSWKGKKMRNADGRTGTIVTDFEGYMHRGLFIKCEDGSKAHVQLNVDGPDTGETGWEWYCEDLSGGPAWLQLGDHNKPVEEQSERQTG